MTTVFNPKDDLLQFAEWWMQSRCVKPPVDGFSKHCLVNGVDELGYILKLEPEIAAFEAHHKPSINALGFAVPGSRWPSLGVAMISLGSGEFERTNDMNDALGAFKESNQHSH